MVPHSKAAWTFMERTVTWELVKNTGSQSPPKRAPFRGRHNGAWGFEFLTCVHSDSKAGRLWNSL